MILIAALFTVLVALVWYLADKPIEQVELRHLVVPLEAAGKYWELLFAFPNQLIVEHSYEAYECVDRFGVEKAARKFHWAFGFDKSGAITELFFPGFVFDSESFEFDAAKLKTLSFDCGWLGKSPEFQYAGFGMEYLVIPEGWETLELERLYLGSQFSSDDLSYLRSLPALKHLQMVPPVRQPVGTVGLDDCPSLESITMFGELLGHSIVEMSRLPNLKKLTLIDKDESMTEPGLLTGLRKKLPEVQIRIVPVGEYQPEPPASFRRHLETLGKSLRQKLLNE